MTAARQKANDPDGSPPGSFRYLTVNSSSQLVVARLESFDRFMRQAGVPIPSAAEGVGTPAWRMKRSKLSKRATTNWDELLTVR